VSDDSSTPVYWRTAILVDVVLLAVGLLMISQDWWTDFAEVVIVVSAIGLPVAVWKLIQVSRRQALAEE
jgi:hypothetical protein